jgi:hypothetical protein
VTALERTKVAGLEEYEVHKQAVTIGEDGDEAHLTIAIIATDRRGRECEGEKENLGFSVRIG